MRKSISFLPVASIVLGGALALSPVAAQATVLPTDLQVTVTETPDGGSAFFIASWVQSSNPTAILPYDCTANTCQGYSTDVPMKYYNAFDGSVVSDVIYYSPVSGGGFTPGDFGFGTYGATLYANGETAPLFAPGTYSGYDVTNGNPMTFTFTPVPEASTWALMLLGFAGLGLAGYRASRKEAALTA